jgi:hypothetical protein
MKKLIGLALVLVCAVAVFSSFANVMIPSGKKVFYILPGEMLFAEFFVSNCEQFRGCSERGILGYKEILDLNGAKEFFGKLEMGRYWSGGMDCYDSLDTVSNIYYKAVIDRELIRWNNLTWLRGVPLKSSKRNSLFIKEELVYADLSNSYNNYSFDFVAIDRIRGDVNGDGWVNDEDVRASLWISSKNIKGDMYGEDTVFYKGRYDSLGLNYGAIILPGHSMPTTLVGQVLLSIFISNPQDSLVRNLGFRKLMSETPSIGLAKSASSAPRYMSEMVGNKLIIKTKPGAAVNVFSFQDGKLWQKDSFADATGQWIVEVPDSAAKYTVEICELDGLINQTSVSPKPAVKNSFQKFSTQNIIYDIMGRKIVSQRSAFGINIIQNGNVAVKNMNLQRQIR